MKSWGTLGVAGQTMQIVDEMWLVCMEGSDRRHSSECELWHYSNDHGRLTNHWPDSPMGMREKRIR